tara:strand:+ start:194 stop:1177 length:984 start_codon:yes stop_codon:yes gene_type:complete
MDLKTDYDNWNGGTYGHDVILYLPLDTLSEWSVETRKTFTDKLASDLNALITRLNEYVREVHLELADDNDPDYQAAKPYQTKTPTNPDTVEFWKPGLVRAFITHRDGHKIGAHCLADALESFGISCFVAHDTIPAQTEWRKQIMLGLETMEIMIVYFTDDFEDSIWTNQEIGYALGAQKPIVCLKLGKKAPGGFVGHIQAVQGSLEAPEASATKLYKLLIKELGASDRLNDALIEAFATSPDWGEARIRFDRMATALTELNKSQLARVVGSFNTNDQLYGAAYLINSSDRMVRWLKNVTGEDYERHKGRLRLMPDKAEKAAWDDMPF